MNSRKRGALIFSYVLFVLAALLVPGVLRPDAPFCSLQQVSAQGDPCLDREVTISAQQVQILQLQGTMNAQEIAYLNLKSTDTALRATLSSAENARPLQILITVPVVITATQNPLPTTAPATAPTQSLPPNCILHTVEAGDSPASIAEQYGVDFSELLRVNGLDDESATFLQIGDVLIVPLPGCSVTSANPPATTEPQASATATLPATATNALVEIVRVLSPGDINAEGVDIRNNGPVVDLTGWELSDSQGNIYIFPQQRLFTGSIITIYTRAGSDTPTARFWGQDSAIWHSGDTITLTDNVGKVQSVFYVP